MCELFGVSSAKPIKINKYLVELVAHSCDNPHGWGFANFREHKVTLHKHPGKASESVQIMSFLKEEIWVNKFFAHIRMGTRGRRSYLNCHPFTVVDCMQRQWTLQHNGTIFTDILDEYEYIQIGETDSERILMRLLDMVNEAEKKVNRDLTSEERFQLIDQLILELVPHNKVNLMIYDGEFMYVHCNLRNTLHEKLDNGARIFATVPLDEEGWAPVPFMQLVVYKDNQLVFEGTKHNYEYIHDPAHYKGLNIK